MLVGVLALHVCEMCMLDTVAWAPINGEDILCKVGKVGGVCRVGKI